MWFPQISIRNNIIMAWIENEDTGEREYCYYLYNIENVVIEKSKWTKEIKHIFVVESEGIFCVRVYRRENGIKSSKSTDYVDYYSETTRSEFEAFCNQKKEYYLINTIKPDYLYKMKYPYKDFALVSDGCSISEDFIKKYGFAKKNIMIGSHCIQILAEHIEFNVPNNYFFSGVAKYKKSLIFGEKDISFFTRIGDHNIGNFAYMKLSRHKIQIGTDYFGTGKVYYYKEGDKYIISNNYHFMLLILKDLSIEVQLNYKLILALLCKSGQAFQQSITREREICNAFMLPIDEFIEINGNGVCFRKKEISTVFKLEKKKDIKNLDKLLAKGKKEIIENVGIVLADKRYSKVPVDLTGGLDSRIVYGALQYLKKYRHKIVILSDGVDSYVNKAIDDDNRDISLAIRLNGSLDKYDYDEICVDRLWLDVDEAENQMVSLSTLSGYYYPHSTTKMINREYSRESALGLNGFYGEICCRPYYTRKLLEQGKKYEDIDAFFYAIASKKGVLSGSAYNALKDKLEEELEALPGENLVEKWENHYLFYRNGLHCNKIWEYEKRKPEWGPLQSKALFRYKHLTFGKIAGIEEQLKVLQKMDKRLNGIPYTSESDEKERINFIALNKENVDLNALEESCLMEEKDKWWKSREKRRSNSTDRGFGEEDYKILKEKGEKYDQELSRRMEELFHKLMNYNNGEFKEVFGIPIYCVLKYNYLSLNEKKMMYQKLLSIYVQVWLLLE